MGARRWQEQVAGRQLCRALTHVQEESRHQVVGLGNSIKTHGHWDQSAITGQALKVLRSRLRSSLGRDRACKKKDVGATKGTESCGLQSRPVLTTAVGPPPGASSQGVGQQEKEHNLHPISELGMHFPVEVWIIHSPGAYSLVCAAL